MEAIEIVEDAQEQVRLIDLVQELRDRYFETFEPTIDAKVLDGLANDLLVRTRITSKSDLPEINVNNGLTILHRLGYKFVVGLDLNDPEEHRIILPFNVDIDAIKNGTVKYSSAWSSFALFRPLYVKVSIPSDTTGITSTNEKLFDLAKMSTEEANRFWSWAVSIIDRKIIAVLKRWSTYTVWPKMIQHTKISDTEFLRISTELGEITGRSFVVSPDIFRPATALAGYAHFVDHVLLGRDTDRLFKELKYDIATKDLNRSVAEQTMKDTYERSVFLYYARERLSAEKYANLVARSSPGMTKAQLMKLLDTKDATMIATAITDEQKKVDAMANNNCPHRKLVTAVSRETVAETKAEILSELSEYIPEGDVQNDAREESLIACNKCKWPLMCPHELIMQRGLAKRQNMKEIKDQLGPYIYPDRVQGNFVCRICGQVILSISAFDNVIDQFEFSAAEEDPEVSSLWSEVSYMTRHVTFENLVNRNSFVSAIVSLIWPLLQTKTTQIMSSRGSSSEELVAKKRINNALYIMAAFINLAVTSSMAGSDKNIVKVSISYPEKTPGKDHLSRMFNYALNVVTDNLAVHIRRVPGLTKDMLATDLTSAYRVISQRKRGPIVQEYDESGNTDSWLNNSWFNYITKHKLKLIDPKAVAKLLEEVAPYKEVTETKKSKKPVAAGKKRNALKARIYDRAALGIKSFNLAMPHMSPEDFYKKYMPNYSAKVPPETFVEHPLWKCFKGLWSKYYDASFSLMTDYMANIYPASAYENGVQNAVMSDFSKSTDRKRLMDYEKSMLRVVRYLNAKYCHPMPDARRYYIRTVSPLGYIYQADGSRRVWNKYGPWSRTGKRWTIDPNIKYEYKHPANKENPWVDSTGYKYGDPVPSDSDVIKAIRARESVVNMIKFYEFICPKGDSHTFSDRVCSKCGYNQGQKMDTTAKSYYDKYLPDYQRDQSLIIGQVTSTVITVPKLPQKKPVTVKPLDFNLVIEAAKFCKVAPNAIASIGSYEGASLKAIQDNKFTAPVTTSKIASRPDKIRSSCIELIARYGSFVNIATNYNPSKELTELLNDIRVPKDIMSAAEFADSFIENYDTVFYNNGSKELVDFALGRFIGMILKLRDQLDKHKNIGPIVDWVLEGAFGAERLGTKPVITNWASIIKAQKEEGDLNTDDTSGPAKDEDDDDPTEFNDGLDLENDSGDPDGDEGNQIKFRGD